MRSPKQTQRWPGIRGFGRCTGSPRSDRYAERETTALAAHQSLVLISVEQRFLQLVRGLDQFVQLFATPLADQSSRFSLTRIWVLRKMRSISPVYAAVLSAPVWAAWWWLVRRGQSRRTAGRLRNWNLRKLEFPNTGRDRMNRRSLPERRQRT